MENLKSGTTSISQLPASNMRSPGTDQPSQVQSNSNNVILTKNDVVSESTTQMQNPVMLQMSSQPSNENKVDYNEMIKQLQQATLAGATGLPSRDIPTNTNEIHTDVKIKPNFIPQLDNTDYIRNNESQNEIVSQTNNKQQNIDSIDSFFNEFQLPLLTAVLYFLFQLPIFRKTIKKILPSL